MLSPVQYAAHVLNLLTTFKHFSFQTLVAHAYPLTPTCTDENQVVVVPDLLPSSFKPLPPIVTLPASAATAHAMLQLEQQQNVFMLQDRETQTILNDYCFKLTYFDDISDLDQCLIDLIEGDADTARHAAHPFVMDALAMFAMQKRHPAHSVRIYGTYLIKWVASDNGNVRLAGLTIMESLHKYVPLDEYLKETMQLREVASLEGRQIVPMPFLAFFKNLVMPVMQMINAVRQDILQMHHYRLTLDNVMLNPETNKVIIKNYYDCAFLLPTKYLCTLADMDVRNMMWLMFVSKHWTNDSKKTFNKAILLQTFKEDLTQPMFHLNADDIAALKQFLDVELNLQDTETTYSVMQPMDFSKYTELPESCSDADVARLGEMLYSVLSYDVQRHALLNIPDWIASLNDLSAKHDYDILYKTISTVVAESSQDTVLINWQQTLRFVMLARFVLLNSHVLDFSAVSQDLFEYQHTLQEINNNGSNPERAFLKTLALEILAKNLHAFKDSTEQSICWMSCVLLCYSYMEDVLLEFNVGGDNEITEYPPEMQFVADWVSQTMHVFWKDWRRVKQHLETHYEDAMQSWLSNHERRPPAIPDEVNVDDDTVADIVPHEWLPSVKALTLLQDTSAFSAPLPFVVVPSTAKKTIENLNFSQVQELFKCLTPRDLLCSIQTMSVCLAEWVNFANIRSSVGITHWVQDIVNYQDVVVSRRVPEQIAIKASGMPMNMSTFNKLATALNMYSAQVQLQPTERFSPSENLALRSLTFTNCESLTQIENTALQCLYMLESLTIENCPMFSYTNNFESCRTLSAVTLKNLPQVTDIRGLRRCQSVNINNCVRIATFNDLRQCETVQLAIPSGATSTFEQLASVQNLSLCLSGSNPQLVSFFNQPNHAHKELTLIGERHLEISNFAYNMQNVEQICFDRCILQTPQDLQYLQQIAHVEFRNVFFDGPYTPTNWGMWGIQILQVLQTMTYLKSLTFDNCLMMLNPELVSTFRDTCKALGEQTHIRVRGLQLKALSLSDMLLDAFSNVRFLSLQFSNIHKKASFVDFDFFSKTFFKTQMLWLENLVTRSDEEWKFVEEFVYRQQYAISNSKFELFWNGVRLRPPSDLHLVHETTEYLRANTTSGNFLNPNTPRIGLSLDRAAMWATVSDDLSSSNINNYRVPCFVRHNETSRSVLALTRSEKACFAATMGLVSDSKITQLGKQKRQERNVHVTFTNGTVMSLRRSEAMGSTYIQMAIADQDPASDATVMVPADPTELAVLECQNFLINMTIPNNMSNLDEIQCPLEMDIWQNTLTKHEMHVVRRAQKSGAMFDILFLAGVLDIRPLNQLLLMAVASMLKCSDLETSRQMFDLLYASQEFNTRPELCRQIEADMEFMMDPTIFGGDDAVSRTFSLNVVGQDSVLEMDDGGDD